MGVLTPYRLTVEDFDTLCAAGAFQDRRVELLNGLLIMMTSGPAHDLAVTATAEALRARLPRDEWTVREEKPDVLSDRWKPLPDVAAVRGHFRTYGKRAPGRDDISLLVEVSDSTYPKDSGFKRRWYARFGVPRYWIIDLNRRVVEDYALRDTELSLVARYDEGSHVPVSLAGRDFERIEARDLLP